MCIYVEVSKAFLAPGGLWGARGVRRGVEWGLRGILQVLMGFQAAPGRLRGLPEDPEGSRLPQGHMGVMHRDKHRECIKQSVIDRRPRAQGNVSVQHTTDCMYSPPSNLSCCLVATCAARTIALFRRSHGRSRRSQWIFRGSRGVSGEYIKVI